MFKAKSTTSKEQLLEIKKELEDLPKFIKELKHMEAGINFKPSDRALDLALISRFDTKEDLATYATHPKHLEVIELIKELCEYTRVVDYES
jgi:antibiotic biosynthesis monooxygenase (ABM) superfamily enzyme